MAASRSYRLLFAPETLAHLDAIDRKYHGLVRRVIQRQLAHHPDVESRNRKPLESPAPYASTWEIRFGPGNRFRVLYDVDERARTVWILAIGEKVRNRICFGEEDFGP